MAVAVSLVASPLAQTNISSSPITFSGQSFGTAAADRLIFFSAWHYQSSSGSFGTPTVGGINANQVVASFSGDFGGFEFAWYWAPVPTGTSGNIVIPLIGGSPINDTMIIDVYRVVGADTSTPVSDGTFDITQSALSITSPSITTPANGAVLVSAMDYANTTTAPTFSSWTNATNDGGTAWSDTVGGPRPGIVQSGHSTTAGAHTITATFTGALANVDIMAVAIQAASGDTLTNQVLRFM